MDIYGLVGKKLSHSFSPDYFNDKFRRLGINAEYRLFEIEHAYEFPRLIANNAEIKGLNITIPYKLSLSKYLNSVDSIVQSTGSVNTIKIKHTNNGSLLTGYNTDVIGFEKTLVPLLKNRNITHALILGTGGSSASIAYVLQKLGIAFNYISRKSNNSQQFAYNWLNKERIRRNLLLINTTPVGMYPNINEALLIPYEFITNKHILYDLIYNPTETQFLKKGSEQGATCINGTIMLNIQAEASWEIWKT